MGSLLLHFKPQGGQAMYLLVFSAVTSIVLKIQGWVILLKRGVDNVRYRFPDCICPFFTLQEGEASGTTTQ